MAGGGRYGVNFETMTIAPTLMQVMRGEGDPAGAIDDPHALGWSR